MPKVITQGYYRLSCGNCASLLEYKQSEVKSGKFNRDYLGGYDTWDYIKCPLCNNRCPTKDKKKFVVLAKSMYEKYL